MDPSHLEPLSWQVERRCSAVFLQVINLSEIILLYPGKPSIRRSWTGSIIIKKRKPITKKATDFPQLTLWSKNLCYITVVPFIVMQRYLDLFSVIISQITSASCTSYFNSCSSHFSAKKLTLIIFASLHLSMLS